MKVSRNTSYVVTETNSITIHFKNLYWSTKKLGRKPKLSLLKSAVT